jgi:alpha-tubulin suppressor-like RCC1 family protein
MAAALWKMVKGVRPRSVAAFAVPNYSPAHVQTAGASIRGSAARFFHSSSANRNGKLFVCGWSQSGALGLGDGVSKVQVPTEVPTEEPVASVVCGKKFTIFATVSGKVFAMGDNTHSELGSSAAGKVSTVPVPVEGLEGVKIVEVSAGANHALALSHQGEVFSWGWGGSSVPGSSVGALGHGDVQTQPRPKKILALEGVKVTQLASGAKHSIVLDAQGNVYTWGFGEQGVFLLDLSYFTS